MQEDPTWASVTYSVQERWEDFLYLFFGELSWFLAHLRAELALEQGDQALMQAAKSKPSTPGYLVWIDLHSHSWSSGHEVCCDHCPAVVPV